MRIDLHAVLLLVLWFASPAMAQNPCVNAGAADALLLAQSESGMSGTGHSGGDESGLGGTGRAPGDESGFGGTGYSAGDESGLGGTGVFGTITAFGSICVNGLRVHYDDETPIHLDGQRVSVAALAIGQVVAVEATGKGQELEARRVDTLHALTGPVARVDRDAGRIYVMDAPVLVGKQWLAENPAQLVGSRVSVSGLRRGDGVVVASRVALASEEQRDGVSGIVRESPHGEPIVGGIRVARLQDAEQGDFVRITGHYRAMDSLLEAKTVSTAPLLSHGSERLSVEGYLHELPGDGRLFLPGVEVERASLERSLERSDRSQRLRVTGWRDRIGRLRVDRVRRVERPNPVRALPRADRTRVDKPMKSADRVRANDRVVRPVRPRAERPPRVDRPPKPDRPSVIDSSLRDIKRLP